MDFNPIEEQLRCMEHIINLAVKAFLYTIDEEGGHNIEDKGTDFDSNVWQHHGPYGRLRNIITVITCTPQRHEEFAKLTQEALPNETTLSPIIANQTRWNSDLKAIKRALQL